MLKNKNYLYFTLLISATLIILKVVNNLITYDEAQTYLNYVYVDNFYNFGIANNHPLNTFLITLSTKISPSVFFIRLPNLVFGFIYLYLSYKISLQYKFSFTVFIILTFNIYLIDFFSLARGYGLSASLIMLGIYIFYYTNNNLNYYFALLFFMLASYSMYYTSIILFSFCVVNIFFGSKFLGKNKIISSAVVLIASTPSVYLMFLVSELDKFLIGRGKFNFADSLYFFGFSEMLNPKLKILGTIQILILILSLNFKKLKSKDSFNLFFILSTSLFLILPAFFNKPIPFGRTLVPYLPLFLIFFIRNIKFFNKNTIVIILIVIFNFSYNYDFNNSLNWNNSLVSKEIYLNKTYDQYGFCNFEINNTNLDIIYTLPAEFYQIQYNSETGNDCK